MFAQWMLMMKKAADRLSPRRPEWSLALTIGGSHEHERRAY
jgi:hypothetical protein